LKGKSLLVLAALGTVPFIMVLGNSMLIPVLPQMQKELGISQFQASLVISLFSIPAGIVIPFAGFLSDRIGRKKVIAPALIIYGIGGIIAGIAALLMKNAYWLIISGRILQGIGAAGTAPVAMALAGDLFTGKERSKALGYIEASNGMGKVVSPVLGSLIGLIAWFATFFMFPVLTVPAALAVWLLIKEPSTQRQVQGIGQYLSSVKNIFANKAAYLLTAFLTGSLALMLLFGILFFLSDYLETSLKLFGAKKGLVLAIPVLFMSTTSLATGAVIKKKVPLMKKMVIGGLGLITLSLALLPFFRSPWANVAIMAVTGIGVGSILPCLNTMITSSASITQRGMITSLYGGVRFFGVAAGPPLFGVLDNFDGRFVMFWSSAAAALITGVLAILFLPSKAPEQTAEESEQDPKQHHIRFGQVLLETITFRNSIGRLVTKKLIKNQGRNQENSDSKNDENPSS